MIFSIDTYIEASYYGQWDVASEMIFSLSWVF